MIEAVNSVLSNASATRVAVEQQSTARSYAANPDKVQEAAKAPYVRSHIAIDRGYNKAVLQIRDSETGDVVRQFPTEGQLKAYRTAQQFSERQKAQTDTHVRQASGASAQQSASVDVPVAADVSVPVPTTASVATSDSPPVSVETEA